LPALASRAGADVRLHRSAPEITRPLRARAVTIGQDIYFNPGEYQPHTPRGHALIAHELAHTLQTRGQQPRAQAGGASPSLISKPNDALEKNAEHLATGVTTHALAAPAGAALRTPLEGETPADQTRRDELLQSIQHAESNLLQLLQSGGLMLGDEVAAERAGIRGVIVPASTLGRSDESFLSYSDRDVMIRGIIRTLIAMRAYYHTNPIPGALPPAVLEPKETPESPDMYSTAVATPYGNASYGGRRSSRSQFEAAYELFLASEGRSGLDDWLDQYYLIPDYTIEPGAARGAARSSRGIASGAYMVSPDLDGDPLRYWRLDGSSPMPEGSTIVEFWHDDFGYYYMHRSQRIDVPSPWSSDRRTR